MAGQMLQDCKLIVGKYDFSAKMNALDLNYSVDALDDTCFGKNTQSNVGGLKSIQFQYDGLFEAGVGGVDEVFFNNIGLAENPVTISPLALAEGDLAYFFKSMQAKYAPGAAVGQLLKFQVSGGAQNSPLVRGTALHNATRTVSGNTSAIQLRAVSALQQVYAALHVLLVSGTTPALVVKVQSDDAQAFSTPTDRITFASQNGANAVWAAPVAGAFTEPWGRIYYANTGTTPSFQFLVPVGIL